MDQENVVYIHNGILFTHKNKGNPAILFTTDLDGIVPNQTKRQILYDLTYMQNLKKHKLIDRK